VAFNAKLAAMASKGNAPQTVNMVVVDESGVIFKLSVWHAVTVCGEITYYWYCSLQRLDVLMLLYQY
jgi:hypothetical protein